MASLDETAFALLLASNSGELRVSDRFRRAMLLGVVAALRPFLARTETLDGGVPWGPTNATFASMVDDYLYNCGSLAHVSRLAAMERYGLAVTKVISEHEIVLEVSSADAEAHDVAALDGLRRFASSRRRQNTTLSMVAPFYMPVSKDFVLLPCFGALMNPFVGIVRHLKAAYRSDWDRAVMGRESVFRDELRDLVRVVSTSHEADVIAQIASRGGIVRERASPLSTKPERFTFPGLSIDVVVNPEIDPAAHEP